MHVQEYDANIDDVFVSEHLQPYLKDLFSDLLMRSTNSNTLDKVTFIEYTKLPGIINDRLHLMFSNFKNSGTSPNRSEESPKEKLQSIKNWHIINKK